LEESVPKSFNSAVADVHGHRIHQSFWPRTDANFKAWRDIWGAGHGVGSVKRVVRVDEVVAELEMEFRERPASRIRRPSNAAQ
jgi:nitronate monooxygenase